jgi:endoglucanase
LYHDSIINAGGFYKSSGFGDELTWAATWLHRATNDATYLTDAKNKFNEFGLSGLPTLFSWDDKKAGVYANLCRATKEATYCDRLRTFCTNSQNARKTSSGRLLYLDQWGSARYASNAVFLMFQATQLNLTNYSTFAKSQLSYLLGSNPQGLSYQIGYGSKFPLRPHHRAASCPADASGTCGWANLNTADANPNVLTGALVGGPKSDDTYPDNREDYQTAEVACDYNALFQGALAAALMY